MKRIESKEENKKRKYKMLMGGIIIFLMIFSTAGYAILSGGNIGGSDFNENQDDVSFTGTHWVYQSGGQSYYFTNRIEDVQDIPSETSLTLNNYVGKPLFFDFENEAVSNEIAGNLERYTSRIQRACYGECDDDLPEKDCSENIIIWKEGGAGKVYQEENCIFIEGDLLVVDSFLYKTLGFS